MNATVLVMAITYEERATMASGEGNASVPGREVEKVGVIGTGLMGQGIAQVSLQAGMSVVLHDTSEERALQARETILGKISRAVERGKLSDSQVEGVEGRIFVAKSLADFSAVDLVVEAVFEDREVKNNIFRELESIVGNEVALCTNTSAIPITEIASGLENPERVIGTHFFSPVPATKLCEIVRGLLTADETVAQAVSWVEALGKESIVVERDDAGFVTSRIMTVIGQEAIRIVEQGLATAEDVDRACELAFGHRMGPLATLDLTGLDIALKAGEGIYRETADPQYASPQLLRRMVSAGRLGRKSGHGFYDYTEKGDK